MSYFLFRKQNSRYWFARIKAGRKSFDKSTKTTNRRTAERVAERLERDALVSGAPISLEKALVMLYQVQVDKGNSPHTLKRTEFSGGHLVGFFGRHRDARTISLEETTAYMRKRRTDGVKDATIYRELRTLKEALSNLRKHGLYDGTPSLLWPTGLPQTFPGKTRWLTPDEFGKLLAALPEHWRDHVTVCVFAGLRRGELFRLRASDVDFDRDRLHAPGTKTEGADRWLPMHPMVRGVLERRCFRAAATDGHIPIKLSDTTSPSIATARSVLFPTGDRTDLREAQRMAMAIRRAAKAAGVAHCSPNDLRRTFCSWCYQNGVSEADCARWLGHKSSSMVRDVYGHDSAENAARKLRAVPSIPDVAEETPRNELN